MLPELELSQALTLFSIVIALAALLISYIRYKTGVMGNRFIREQIMRERFEKLPQEHDLPSGEVKLSEPRVRSWGFKRWLRSLLPKQSFPGYTHFNVRFRQPNYPDPLELELLDEKQRNIKLSQFAHPPPSEELENNDKLSELDVFKVIQLREPMDDGSGEYYLSLTSDYAFYADTADPDQIGNVIESVPDIFEEIQTGDTVVELHDRPLTREDFDKI